METGPIDRTIEVAARWYARLQAPDCTEHERDECERWCALDASHRAAYEAAERLSARITLLATSDSRLKALADQAFADHAVVSEPTGRSGGVAHARGGSAVPRRPTVRRRRVLAEGALAAGLVAAALVAGFWRHDASLDAKDSAALLQAATAAEMRTLTLTDGTSVRLDVDSELEARLTATRREITLTRGRALFDVAHDPERPFYVRAGSGRVTALGTIFQVERADGEIIVTLTEGAVTVTDESDGRTRSAQLAPGEQLSILAGTSAWRRRSVDSRAVTSWSIGRHVFRQVRLADALAEINRYAEKKVRVADPTLADLTVSGTFVTGNSEAIVAAFAALLPLEVSADGAEIVLTRRSKTPAPFSRP